MCCEAGGRVLTNIFTRDLDLGVMADFGQTDFGQFFDRFWPIVVLTDFSQTNFGQFWCFGVLAKCSGVVVVVVVVLLCCGCVVVVLWCVVVLLPNRPQNLAWESGRGPTCCGFGIVVVVVVVVVAGLDFPGPPSLAKSPSTGHPSTWPPKISLFFFPFPPPFRSFCVSLGVFSLNFGGVLKAGTLKCARLGSRVVVSDRAAGARTRQPEKLQTCTFQGPGTSKHHQNSTKDTWRDTERVKR